MKYLLLCILFICQALPAAAREINEYRWEDVDRIIAIGDLHGDYENYMATLIAADLVNERGKWIAGATHLVQTGDIPDRGPDTQKIIAHMRNLAAAAAKKGGRVHNLMGNHEAMNVYGDLRYVTPAEFEDFVDARSAALRDKYFDAVMKHLKTNDPERFAALPEDYKEQWYSEHPLGWLEHRYAWNPGWDPDGKLFQWVMQTKAAIQINGLIFLHGGISGHYCQNSLASLDAMVHAELRQNDPRALGILQDQFGPLWYRGLSGVEPQAAPETVAAILQQHEARHIVVGHTPTGGMIWPRYDGRVIQIDTGIGAHYGGHIAYLEVTGKGLFAGYRTGKIELPDADSGRLAYLEQVVALEPENTSLQKRLEQLKQPLPEQEPETATPAEAVIDDVDAEAVIDIIDPEEIEDVEDVEPALEEETEIVPICGIVQ